MPRMDSGADQVGRLLKGRTGKELEALLDRNLRPRDIEMGLGTPRVGPQPTFPTSRVPLTPEMREILKRYGLDTHPLFQTMEAHELGRLKSVFGTDRLPKAANDILKEPGVRWALDGAKSPGDVANRWEYFTRVKFRDVRRSVAEAATPGLSATKIWTEWRPSNSRIPPHSQRWMLSWSHAKKP